MSKSNKPVATTDEELKVFVRTSDRALEPGEMERVAGGTGTCIIPNGRQGG